MKVIRLNDAGVFGRYCIYPDYAGSLDEFIGYLNTHPHTFVPMEVLDEDGCAEPYFIEENTKTIYFNTSQIREVCERDITVLPKDEYRARLEAIVRKKCVKCTEYKDGECSIYGGSAGNINLDGECHAYEAKE